MEVIVLSTEAYRQLRDELKAELRDFLNEWKNSVQGPSGDQPVWLSPEQARLLVGLKSRRCMKTLRESGAVHYAKIGREFRYDKKSLTEYITAKSTMKYKFNVSNKQKPKSK